MAKLWPLCWVVQVLHANPTHTLTHMAAGGSRVSTVETHTSKTASESILSLHTDEQKESPLN